jgi:hypothetical protein
LNASEFVTLIDGPTLPLQALQLAWDLEDRGVVLSIRDGDLCAGPRRLLTDADREAIRRWRKHLMAIVAYHREPVQ